MSLIDFRGKSILMLLGSCDLWNQSAVVMRSGQCDKGVRSESADKTRGCSNSGKASLPAGRLVTIQATLPER